MPLGPTERAIRIFRKHGGILGTKQTLAFGIHPPTLYTMRDASTLDQVSRGVERFPRLSRSRHADRFVLKGALLLPIWGGPTRRTTKDIEPVEEHVIGIRGGVERTVVRPAIVK